MKLAFNWITVVSAVFLIVLVLVQNQGSSLGTSFGGDSGFYRSKRGAERLIFNLSIITGVVFVLSVLLSVLTKS
jgi:preprotein translocase subunit SecG